MSGIRDLAGRLARNDFVRAGTIMMVLGMAGSVVNMLCRMALGRLLTTVQYGEMEAILQVGSLIGIPVSAVQMTLVQYVASALAEGRPDEAGAIMWRATRRLMLYSLAALAILAAGAPWIRDFFHLNSTWPVFAGASVFVSSLVATVSLAGLQGAQMLVRGALIGVAGALARILFSWLLIRPGYGATGALAGLAASNLFMTALGAFGVRTMLAVRARSVDTRPMYRYLGPAVLAIGVWTLLGNVDLLVVKHFFHPDVSGAYARASAIGRTVLSLNGVFLTILFPKVAGAAAQGRRTLHLLGQAVLWGLLVHGAGAWVCSTWPQLPIRVLHGAGHEAIGGWVAALVWALVPQGMTVFVAQYLMGRRSFKFLALLTPSVLLFLAAIWALHQSIERVILVLAGGGVLCLAACALAVWWDERSGGCGGQPEPVRPGKPETP